MPLIAAIYCFFIGLFLVLLSFIFQLSPGWKELFLIVTVLNYGFVISAPPLFTPFPDKIYRIDGRCNEILPHHNLIFIREQSKLLSQSFLHRYHLYVRRLPAFQCPVYSLSDRMPIPVNSVMPAI